MSLSPDQKRFQRDLALKHVARAREAAKSHPMTDQRIAAAVAPQVSATPDQVLSWMKEARV
ncbi:hypothetical protein ACIPPQ_20245 [Sphingopyxis sp. LARHCG72]